MPRDASGNYTLPTGNPVVAGTTITTSWANPTMSDLGSELTNSLDRQGRGGMLAPLRVPDGTAENAAVGFVDEVNTGLQRTENGLFVNHLGTAVVRFNAAGSALAAPILFSGDVAGVPATTVQVEVSSTGTRIPLFVSRSTLGPVLYLQYTSPTTASDNTGLLFDRRVQAAAGDIVWGVTARARNTVDAQATYGIDAWSVVDPTAGAHRGNRDFYLFTGPTSSLVLRLGTTHTAHPGDMLIGGAVTEFPAAQCHVKAADVGASLLVECTAPASTARHGIDFFRNGGPMASGQGVGRTNYDATDAAGTRVRYAVTIADCVSATAGAHVGGFTISTARGDGGNPTPCAQFQSTGAVASVDIVNATQRTKIAALAASPEGAVVAEPGSLACVNNAGTGELWLKQTGTGSTGWVKVL